MAIASSALNSNKNSYMQCCPNIYGDVFADNSGDLGKTDEIQHTIDTRNAPPIRQLAYCIPVTQQEEVRKLLQEILEKNVIQPSRNPWAAPVVLVKKKGWLYLFLC